MSVIDRVRRDAIATTWRVRPLALVLEEERRWHAASGRDHFPSGRLSRPFSARMVATSSTCRQLTAAM